jgi:hypothetical protein
LYQKLKRRESRLKSIRENAYQSPQVDFTAANVRDALDSLVNSKEQELRLLVAYNASLLEFEVSKNQLFETYGIDVEKYIPKEK